MTHNHKRAGLCLGDVHFDAVRCNSAMTDVHLRSFTDCARAVSTIEPKRFRGLHVDHKVVFAGKSASFGVRADVLMSTPMRAAPLSSVMNSFCLSAREAVRDH